MTFSALLDGIVLVKVIYLALLAIFTTSLISFSFFMHEYLGNAGKNTLNLENLHQVF